MSGAWDAKKLPSLSTPRRDLSAVAVNNQVYAVCGVDKDRNRLNSIEVLGVRINSSGWVNWVSQKWSTLDVKDFTPREKPLVAPLSNRCLLVYGGRSDQGLLHDGVVIDLARKSVTSHFIQPDIPLLSVCSG